MLSSAERLLQDLGITDPDEIDLEAIAFHVGASVRYRSLDGCEARIVGYREKAIITVNANSSFERGRFSIAHELGHWHHHRGKSLACRVEEYQPHATKAQERTANTYAANLMMPPYLFCPLAQRQGKLTFKMIGILADTFKTSHTATAIRLVESDHTPALLVCHDMHGRQWFTRAPSVPDRWFPKEILDPDSSAFTILFGRAPNTPTPRKIGAGAWFDGWEAPHFEIHEQSMRTGDGEVITLILMSDAHMLQDRDRPSHSHYR